MYPADKFTRVEVSILRSSTVSDTDQRAAPADPQASLRAELLGQIVGAQFALEDAIAALSRSGANTAALAQSHSQLRSLLALQGDIGSASPALLAGMHAQVAATVAATQAMAEEGRVAAASAELSHLAADSRDQVTSLMDDMHRFDPYLRFGSAEEEAAYRQREAERRTDVDAQQAKHTPEGDLNAAGAAVGQMADADAHGAGNSPEFKQRWDALVTTTEKLREAAKANGVSTEEFDRRLREDLRTIMKSKGLTDAQIDAKFAATPDPLAAAKEYVQSGDDVKNVQRSIDSATRSQPIVTTADAPASNHSMMDAIAKLQAAGVVAGSPAATEVGHGVAQPRVAQNDVRTI